MIGAIMDQEDIDINLLIQSYSQKITLLTNEVVVKETMIKQLASRVESLEEEIKNLSKEN
jgi:cell division protein FtsB